MRDFEVKNAKIFWGGLSPPQTPPNNEEGDTPPQTPPLNVGKLPTFCHSSPPHQRILDPSLEPGEYWQPPAIACTIFHVPWIWWTIEQPKAIYERQEVTWGSRSRNSMWGGHARRSRKEVTWGGHEDVTRGSHEKRSREEVTWGSHARTSKTNLELDAMLKNKIDQMKQSTKFIMPHNL